MYRARIDSVSGTKVYADGKWLYCIGNKNHRVGDYVWTDGRCAYGHFQESQQPQVIIAPDDEGIPIYAVDRNHLLYTFQKNKLKKVDELERPKVIPDGWSKVRLINDKRRVFTHKYLASNIDKHGNIFVMAEIVKIDDSKHITEDKVAIFKDDKSKSELTFKKVKEIDLLEFWGRLVEPKCPETNSYPSSEGNGIDYFWGGDVSILKAFIEDDTNFEILVSGSIGKGAMVGTYYIVETQGYEADYQIKNDEENLIREVHTSRQRDYEIASHGGISVYLGLTPEDDAKFVHVTETENNNKVTCQVGDGFYCTLQWERFPEFVENNTKAAGGEYRYHFFSPDNTEIANIHAELCFKILFRKVKGHYLICLYDIPFKIYKFFEAKDEIDRGKAFAYYLYSIATKTLTPLDDVPACSNDRLRPMTNIKRWHKRIKEIVLDLDDEKEN